MGNAKLRGSFEVRQIEGVLKRKLESERIEKENIERNEAIKRKEAERIASMSPIELEEYRYNKVLMQSLFASLEMHRQ